MTRTYTDFNSQDKAGRVSLSTAGALEDIALYADQLTAGMEIMLYCPDDFEVRGTLVFDDGWLGVPMLETLRYYNED